MVRHLCGLAVVCSILAVVGALCVAQASLPYVLLPGSHLMGSPFLQIWVEVSTGGNWVRVGADKMEPATSGYPNPEVQSLVGPNWQALPFMVYTYRIHPRVEVDYRIGLVNTTTHPIAVVLSVDGKNSLNAAETVQGNWSDQAWVLPDSKPVYYYVSGWQASMGKGGIALSFRFTKTLPSPVMEGEITGQIRADVYFPNDLWLATSELALPLTDPCTASSSGPIAVFMDRIGSYDTRAVDAWTGMGLVVGSSTTPVGFTSLTRSPVAQILVSYSDKLQAFLGIVVRSVGTIGAEVLYIIPGSPADVAGILPGQIITYIDGKLVTSAAQAAALVHARNPGDTVSLYLSDTARVTSKTIFIPLGEW